MISSRDITVLKIVTSDVFRHTPFEHETTTDGLKLPDDHRSNENHDG